MSHDYERMSASTLCCHANQQKDQYGAAVFPIYQSSTFVFDTAEQGGRRFAGEESGFIYTRLGNPTTNYLEGRIAALEHGEACSAASSGMGSIASTLWTILKAGDHVIADDTLYGCTMSLFAHQLPKFGIDVQIIDTSKPGAVKNALKPNTKVVYFETPANPTMKIIDIKRVADEAHSQPNVYVIVDNTFASPIITKPIDFGVDVVVHSATKYLNGHSDVVAGFAVGPADLIQRIKMEGIKDMTGSVLSPNDAFLVTRGLMTLDIRVQKQSENAMRVAEFLASHPAVDTVAFPGLKNHPGHDIAAKQMKYFGSMMSFELKSGIAGGKKLLNNLHLLTLAVSLGSCESLIQHPASMTHACVSREGREKAGITDGMVRLSVGIEDADDIINDLKQALDMLL